MKKTRKLEDRASNVEHRMGPPPPNREAQLCRGVVDALTLQEQEDLSRALVALEPSSGRASLESLPPEQKAAFMRATDIYMRLKNERGGDM